MPQSLIEHVGVRKEPTFLETLQHRVPFHSRRTSRPRQRVRHRVRAGL